MSERGPIQEVNIELGNDASRMLYEASKYTYENRPGFLKERHASFSGLRTWNYGYFKNTEGCLDSDGVGTKVEVAERLEDHTTIAFDLFAMACDDPAVKGAEPVAVSTVLDTNSLKDPKYVKSMVKQLGQGSIAAAKAAGVVITGGEFAELGKRVSGYGEFNYNWCATVVWAGHEDRLLSGHQIEPGHSLIGFAERGFRSNGLTDVRMVMEENFGPEWHNEIIAELGGLSLGRLVQTPSIIYSKLLTDLTGGFDIDKKPMANITGAAHITGGGQPEKLGRMLEPSGYGLIIDKPIDPPQIMQLFQRLSGFSDERIYGKMHMGTGMVVVAPQSEEEKIVAAAKPYGIEAKPIGHITEEPGIRTKNRGVQQEQEFLHF